MIGTDTPSMDVDALLPSSIKPCKIISPRLTRFLTRMITRRASTSIASESFAVTSN
ncbi:hypothetical protein M405DRAFT_811550 [Rhizopogon salebrosus TDB-379]|nr:hypothetical protein M405DRAFT_811550 [Rhizopogon salebrosus TDB-379]